MTRFIFCFLGVLFISIGVEHGAAYFVLSGSWRGDTPWELLLGLLAGCLSLSVAACAPSREAKVVSKEPVGLGPAKAPDSGLTL
jgi:hypothetical protein